MAVITDIKPQVRREGRVSVFLDDEFFTGMPLDVAASLRLTVGDTVDDARRADIEREVGETVALEAAMNLLGHRARSEKEMRQRLARKEFGEGVIEATIKRLYEYRYLDDADFASQLAESERGKGRGRRAAEHALRQAGVATDIISVALDGAYPDGEAEAALEWLRRRSYDLSTPQGRQKLTRQLAGRGFGWEVISEVISRLQDGDTGDD